MRALRLLGLALLASATVSGLAFSAGQDGATEETAASAASMGGAEIVKIGGVYTWPRSWLEAPVASALNITSFSEAPALAQLVQAGELPPVTERLPDDPLVFEPYEEVGRYGGTLRVARLSPGDWGDMHRGHKVFPYRADPSTSEAIPMLFAAFDASSDGTVWTFHLRPGVKWSDGQPFTTADIMFAYDYIFRDPDIPHGTRNRFTVNGELAQFDPLDDYTLRVTFAGPVSKLITMQMLNWTRIKQGDFFVPAHYMNEFHVRTNRNAEALAKEHGYEGWVAHFMARRDMSPKQPFTMPELSAWTLEDRDATGIYMVRNPYFWAVDTAGNQLPYIDRIEARYFSDKQVAILSMMQGKIDIGGRMMNPDEFPLYLRNQDEGDYRILQWQDTKMTRVGYQFNLMHPDPVKRQVFADIRFRRAASVAIDRVAVNEFAFQGLATPSQMTIDPGASFADPAWTQNYAEYDPEQAKSWLAEVGLEDTDGDGVLEGPDGRPFVIDLLVSSESVLGTMGFTVSEIVAENWRDVGLQVNLRQDFPGAVRSAEPGGRARRRGVSVGQRPGDQGDVPGDVRQRALPRLRNSLGAVDSSSRVGAKRPPGTGAAGRRAAPRRGRRTGRELVELGRRYRRGNLPASRARGLGLPVRVSGDDRHGRQGSAAHPDQQPRAQRARSAAVLVRDLPLGADDAGAMVHSGVAVHFL